MNNVIMHAMVDKGRLQDVWFKNCGRSFNQWKVDAKVIWPNGEIIICELIKKEDQIHRGIFKESDLIIVEKAI